MIRNEIQYKYRPHEIISQLQIGLKIILFPMLVFYAYCCNYVT